METKKDFFKEKSQTYDTSIGRLENVLNISNAILKRVSFKKDMELMDFGSGTGLLTEQLASYVKKITCVDISPSMNKKILEKKEQLGCELEVIELDLSQESLDQKFDGIISSMTLHHIEDLQKLFEKFYRMLHKGGSIALADLYTEDGSFHSQDTGVFHFGFDEHMIKGCAQKAKFQNINVEQVSIAKGKYPIFLLTAFK